MQTMPGRRGAYEELSNTMTSLSPPWQGAIIYFHGDQAPGEDMQRVARELHYAAVPVVAVRHSANRMPRDREILVELTGNPRDVMDNPRARDLIDAVGCRRNDN